MLFGIVTVAGTPRGCGDRHRVLAPRFGHRALRPRSAPRSPSTGRWPAVKSASVGMRVTPGHTTWNWNGPGTSPTTLLVMRSWPQSLKLKPPTGTWTLASVCTRRRSSETAGETDAGHVGRGERPSCRWLQVSGGSGRPALPICRGVLEEARGVGPDRDRSAGMISVVGPRPVWIESAGGGVYSTLAPPGLPVAAYRLHDRLADRRGS